MATKNPPKPKVTLFLDRRRNGWTWHYSLPMGAALCRSYSKGAETRKVALAHAGNVRATLRLDEVWDITEKVEET